MLLALTTSWPPHQAAHSIGKQSDVYKMSIIAVFHQNQSINITVGASET